MAPSESSQLDSKLVQNSWDLVRASRELLSATEPLVRRIHWPGTRTETIESAASVTTPRSRKAWAS